MDNYDAMARAIAERNRAGRRVYTVLLPIAVAGLIAALLAYVVLRGSVDEPPVIEDSVGW